MGVWGGRGGSALAVEARARAPEATDGKGDQPTWGEPHSL